jgi:hypothetical protein
MTVTIFTGLRATEFGGFVTLMEDVMLGQAELGK